MFGTSPSLTKRTTAKTTTAISSVQAKVVDAPRMFRDRGIHPRACEPGIASPKFARANTNVPLWSGDSATAAPVAVPTRSDMLSSQRLQGKFQMLVHHLVHQDLLG